MREPQELRCLARSCRELATTTFDPDIIEQLRIWAVELADEADEIEREEPSSARPVHPIRIT
jgi:hypothetical protein